MLAPGRRPARGFTYLGVLFLVALLALTAALATTSTSFVSQRDKERELLFAGRQFAAAIERYRAAHAASSQPYPVSLEALLGEGRPRVVRYIRRLYLDPMTESPDWGLVRTPAGGIIGVFSLSERTPLRRRSPYGDEPFDLAGAQRYRDWVFGRMLAGITAQATKAAVSAPAVPARAPVDPVPEDTGAPPLQWPGGHPPSGSDDGS